MPLLSPTLPDAQVEPHCPLRDNLVSRNGLFLAGIQPCAVFLCWSVGSVIRLGLFFFLTVILGFSHLTQMSEKKAMADLFLSFKRRYFCKCLLTIATAQFFFKGELKVDIFLKCSNLLAFIKPKCKFPLMSALPDLLIMHIYSFAYCPSDYLALIFFGALREDLYIIMLPFSVPLFSDHLDLQCLQVGPSVRLQPPVYLSLYEILMQRFYFLPIFSSESFPV